MLRMCEKEGKISLDGIDTCTLHNTLTLFSVVSNRLQDNNRIKIII